MHSAACNVRLQETSEARREFRWVLRRAALARFDPQEAPGALDVSFDGFGLPVWRLNPQRGR